LEAVQSRSKVAALKFQVLPNKPDVVSDGCQVVPEKLGIDPVNSQVVPSACRGDAVKVESVSENYQVVWKDSGAARWNPQVHQEEFQLSPAKSRGDPHRDEEFRRNCRSPRQDLQSFLTAAKCFIQMAS